MKVLYLDSLAKMEFTQEQFDNLIDVHFVNTAYKKIFLHNGCVVLAPVNRFHEVEDETCLKKDS